LFNQDLFKTSWFGKMEINLASVGSIDMRFKNIILVLGTAILMMACSGTPKTDNMDSAGSDSMDLLQKGFLLSLPVADGWKVVKKSDYKVFLAKQGTNEGDQYTLQTVVVSLPSFENDEEFMDYIKHRMMRDGSTQETTLFTGHGDSCVENNSKEEKQEKGKTMILEMINFTCRHPDNKNAGVYLAYSKKYSPGNGDKDFAEKALELFNHLYFTEL
jgi:hypothetical protein